MCCNDPCKVTRCHGCPKTDWSAFTWRWTAPAAAADDGGTPIRRRFAANAGSMTYPGVCRCTWLIDGGDIGTDIVGTFHPIETSYPIPSIGSLEYRYVGGFQYSWILTLSRWNYGWDWTSLDERYYGNGWGWSPSWTDHDCQSVFGNPYWGGYGGYGWNGWGWGYGGYAGYNVLYGQNGTLNAVTYSMQDGVSMDCTGGTVRFYLNPQPDTEGFDPAEWPAYVDIARVEK